MKKTEEYLKADIMDMWIHLNVHVGKSAVYLNMATSTGIIKLEILLILCDVNFPLSSSTHSEHVSEYQSVINHWLELAMLQTAYTRGPAPEPVSCTVLI